MHHCPADPGYAQTTLVLNPFSEVILEVFGRDIGAHARTAFGVATVVVGTRGGACITCWRAASHLSGRTGDR